MRLTDDELKTLLGATLPVDKACAALDAYDHNNATARCIGPAYEWVNAQ